MAKQKPIPRISRVLRLVIAYSAVWVALAGAEPSSWILGGPMVAFAVAATILLHREAVLFVSPTGLCLFIPYFILQSVMSGIDVLRRAFSPRLPINPGMISYETFLPEGAARILFANTISLLPGTLSADLRNEEIVIHALDIDQPVYTNLRKLEVSIARIFLKSPAGEKSP